MVEFETNDTVATITLNDPARRNALSAAMFDALDGVIAEVRAEASCRVVLLRGAGRAFCAGFDLEAVVRESALMATFIERLSTLIRSIRRLPQPVVDMVHGAAIAGGCAVLTACDFVVVEADARLGYPVHAIGVSPAVTLPTLSQQIGAGAARALVLSGELIDGRRALAIGLGTHLARGRESLDAVTRQVVADLRAKPPGSLRATKAWLNELDGSLDDDRFDRPVAGSVGLARGPEAQQMLNAFWAARRGPAAT